ncbi:MAG: peptide-methionine (S)-S-oxide reductase [Gemmataceae bacterium]|nr:peptide-methionine (S)-S-oxide reductase [Gemmataceae bacterium]
MAQAMATLGGGCFWCLEAVFERLRGVKEVVSGYAGGSHPSPDYEQVCSGTTGHAEVVQIAFDPEQTSYQEILRVFFTVHDPTTLNRQGADIGTQYRSIILFHDPGQEKEAQEMIARLNVSGAWFRPIVTEVAPLPPFHRAEDHHQQYFQNHPAQGYCQAVVGPKVAKFLQQHPDLVS